MVFKNPRILRYVLPTLLTFVFFNLLSLFRVSKHILNRFALLTATCPYVLLIKTLVGCQIFHYVTKTHNTHNTHPLVHNKLCTMKIVLVGFLPDGHGHSCETHPYGCGNAFIESTGNGSLVHLVENTNLAVYNVWDDGTDGCHICFTAQEYTIRENTCLFDGLLLQITEVFLLDSSNRSMRALYHCNSGYACSGTIDNIW